MVIYQNVTKNLTLIFYGYKKVAISAGAFRVLGIVSANKGTLMVFPSYVYPPYLLPFYCSSSDVKH